MKPLVLTALICAALTPRAHAQELSRPTGCDDCIGNWFYFDQVQGEGSFQDWNCLESTYDQHKGTDFSLNGGNGAIAEGYEVTAAAEGVVRSAVDGFFDQCDTCESANCNLDVGFGYGNHIIVDHGDRTVVYAHLRMGSIRVAVGQLVACGQPIAEIGSSGCSTGAHLHFETRPSGGDSSSAYDPYVGSCSPTSNSVFFDQGPYQSLPLSSCGGVCALGDTPWECNELGTERLRCVGGEMQSEECSLGCISGGAEASCGMPICMPGMDTAWSCSSSERIRCMAGSLQREVCGFGCVSNAGVAMCISPTSDLDGDGVPFNRDCDDENRLIYPGATETCGDGIDQDCNGMDDPCAVPVDSGPPPSTPPGGVGVTRTCAAHPYDRAPGPTYLVFILALWGIIRRTHS